MKKFLHLTSRIKNRVIKEQPYVWLDKDDNKEFFVIIYKDGYYSVHGKSKNNLSFCLLYEKDLTDEMITMLENMIKNNILK